MPKIRTLEVNSSEVFVDVNDLLIELMLEADRCTSEPERKAYQALIHKLTEIRNKGHKH
jgi:hypothetical protein